jgi:hypothetical protein
MNHRVDDSRSNVDRAGNQSTPKNRRSRTPGTPSPSNPSCHSFFSHCLNAQTATQWSLAGFPQIGYRLSGHEELQ